MEDEEIKALQKEVERSNEIAKYRRGLGLAALVMSFVFYAVLFDFPSVILAAASWLFLGIFVTIVLSVTEARTLRKLLSGNDARYLGPLLDMQTVRRGDANVQLRRKIQELLPCLTADNAALLNATHRLLLQNELLRYARDTSALKKRTLWYLAILKGLSVMDDPRILDTARRVIQAEAVTDRQQQILKEAERCYESVKAQQDFTQVDIGDVLDGIPLRADSLSEYRTLALLHHLPQITPENKDSLTDKQWKTLYNLLAPGISLTGDSLYHNVNHTSALCLAILDVANRLEDVRALEAVRIHSRASAFRAERVQVRAAARELLPLLEAKAAQQEVGKTLLRASETPAHPETLLRPTSSYAVEAQSTQLLRAVNASEESE